MDKEVHLIPIQNLCYIWAKVEGNVRYNDYYLQAMAMFEKNMPLGLPVSALLHSNFNIGFMQHLQKQHEQVYKHILINAKPCSQCGVIDFGLSIVNPLVVFPVNHMQLVVLTGNRRLNALRALKWTGNVKCYFNPDWKYRNIKEFGYVEVEGF